MGTTEGGSHVLHHPPFLSFVFLHVDVILTNLSGFMKCHSETEDYVFCFQDMT